MKVFHENFDHLHFTECLLGAISIQEELAEIVIEQGLIFLGNHPAFPMFGSKCPHAILRWHFVHECYIKSNPYIGDPILGVFGTPHTESRIFSNKTDRSRNYEVEGITAINPAWHDININADKFELLLL